MSYSCSTGEVDGFLDEAGQALAGKRPGGVLFEFAPGRNPPFFDFWRISAKYKYFKLGKKEEQINFPAQMHRGGLTGT